jgi:hypothetical protein
MMETGTRGLRRITKMAFAGLLTLAAAGGGLAPSATEASSTVGFAAHTFVDTVRAGGEPGIMHSNKFGNLVYTSHEGTTHIDRSGGPASIQQFLCPGLTTADCYKNHVWIWTSDDNGASWQLRDEALPYTGFSDPDLTQDAGGTVYNTGIDLANDSVFSSLDGGKTWTNGTTNCHEGDRPWLAGGGNPGEVYMATDTEENGHEVFYSKDYANSCSANGIVDNGTCPSSNNTCSGDTWSGFGKLVYDRFDGSLIEPAQFTHADGSIGIGISRLPNAHDAFNGGSETWQPTEVVQHTTVYSPFGAPEVMSMDSAQNIYFAWDTNERDPNGTGGCSLLVPNTGGGPTPLPNHIMFVAGSYVSSGTWSFSTPIALASPTNSRVLWPWSVAGSAGNVSVVWYQMDKMVDPDCDIYNGQTVPDVKTYIYEAYITNATNPGNGHVNVVNASGRFIHQGGICDSGTTCVATGQDRRLGDYFTNSVDARGCVVIASGDTTVMDPITGGPRATSLPIFIRQISGPSLTTGKSCG